MVRHTVRVLEFQVRWALALWFGANERIEYKIFIHLNNEMPIRLKTIFNPNLHKNVVMWTWPSGSKQYLFLFVLFSRDSLLIFIFFIIFCCDGLNAWDLPVPTTLRGFVMVSSLEFHGWSTCTNNFQPPQWTSLVETGDSNDSDRETNKIMKKYRNYQRWFRKK